VAGKNDKPKEKKPNKLAQWWRETLGELRKVSWPTPQDAWKLTKIVLYVMLALSIFLGIADYVFSKLITLLVTA
jgi:preprotein translocase subunit SecE